MRVSIFQKYYICHIGKKDAKKAYGTYLLGWKPTEELKPSDYMKELVIEYQGTPQRSKILDGLCFKVIQQFENLHTEIAIINENVKQLNEQANQFEKKVNDKKTYLNHLQKEKDLAIRNDGNTIGSGFPNLGALCECIKRTEEEIRNLKEQENDLQGKVLSKENEINEKKKKAFPSLLESITEFKKGLNELYSSVENIRNVCELKLHYYWQGLMDKLEKHKHKYGVDNFDESSTSISFEEICRLCNYQIIPKEQLYHEERERINKQIEEFDELSITV